MQFRCRRSYSISKSEKFSFSLWMGPRVTAASWNRSSLCKGSLTRSCWGSKSSRRAPMRITSSTSCLNLKRQANWCLSYLRNSKCSRRSGSICKTFFRRTLCRTVLLRRWKPGKVSTSTSKSRLKVWSTSLTFGNSSIERASWPHSRNKMKIVISASKDSLSSLRQSVNNSQDFTSFPMKNSSTSTVKVSKSCRIWWVDSQSHSLRPSSQESKRSLWTKEAKQSQQSKAKTVSKSRSNLRWRRMAPSKYGFKHCRNQWAKALRSRLWWRTRTWTKTCRMCLKTRLRWCVLKTLRLFRSEK